MIILLVTGFGDENQKVEIIKDDNTPKVCDSIDGYPLNVNHVSGSVWNDGNILISGSGTQCYTLVDGSWELVAQTQINRESSAMSNVGERIWITGGTTYLDSTEIVNADGMVSAGPNLQEKMRGHCQVTHDDTTFIIGK